MPRRNPAAIDLLSLNEHQRVLTAGGKEMNQRDLLQEIENLRRRVGEFGGFGLTFRGRCGHCAKTRQYLACAQNTLSRGTGI
jgi:hypothetical protein